MTEKNKNEETKENAQKDSPYYFGTIKEFNLEQIESEVLFDKVYLDVFAGSDFRFKTNISPITDALKKVVALDSVNFEWATANAPTGTQAGLIAQQVASLMPELTKSDPVSGMVKVNYMQLSAYLVAAMKDMTSLLDKQDERIKQLESRLH